MLPLRLSITVASLPCYFTSPSLKYTLLLVVCVLLQHFAGIIRWQDMVVQYGLVVGCSTIKDYWVGHWKTWGLVRVVPPGQMSPGSSTSCLEDCWFRTEKCQTQHTTCQQNLSFCSRRITPMLFCVLLVVYCHAVWCEHTREEDSRQACFQIYFTWIAAANTGFWTIIAASGHMYSHALHCSFPQDYKAGFKSAVEEECRESIQTATERRSELGKDLLAQEGQK